MISAPGGNRRFQACVIYIGLVLTIKSLYFGTSVSNPAMGEPVTAGASWLIDDFRPCQEEVGEILCGTPGMQSSSQGWYVG